MIGPGFEAKQSQQSGKGDLVPYNCLSLVQVVVVFRRVIDRCIRIGKREVFQQQRSSAGVCQSYGGRWGACRRSLKSKLASIRRQSAAWQGVYQKEKLGPTVCTNSSHHKPNGARNAKNEISGLARGQLASGHDSTTNFR